MNKQSITKILLTILISMMGANAFAHDIVVKNADGVTIYFNWDENKTELIVSYQGRSRRQRSDAGAGLARLSRSRCTEDRRAVGREPHCHAVRRGCC